MIARRIDELALEMEALGLKLDDLNLDQKGVKKVMIQRLQEFFLEENFGDNIPETLKQVLEFESPMLCFRFKDLKESEQEDVLGGEDWVVEEKFNGVRCLISYHEHEGFRFYSRHLSVQDYLPVNLTHCAPIIHSGEVHFGHDTRLKGVESFVIDAELVCTRGRLKIGKEVSTSALSAMVALSNAGRNLVKEVIDREWKERQEPLVLVKVFDLLMVGGEDLTGEPLLKRKVELKKRLHDFLVIVNGGSFIHRRHVLVDVACSSGNIGG